MRRLSMLALFAALFTLAGCGFQLRGSDSIPGLLQPLQVSGVNPNNDLGQALYRELRLRGTELAGNGAGARYQLALLGQDRESRILSLDPRANAGEIALTESVRFELRNERGEVVLGPVTLRERRVMVNDPDRRVDKDNEANTLRDEMLTALASRVVRRLQAYRPDKAADAQPDSEPTPDSHSPDSNPGKGGD